MKRLAVVVMALAFGACGISKEEAKKALDRQKTELVRMHEEKIADVQKQLEAAKAELEKVKAESAAAVAAAATSKDGDLAAANAKAAKLSENIAAATTALNAAKGFLGKKDVPKATAEVDKALNALK